MNPKVKILIVEDNPENMELLAEILRDTSDSYFAATGHEALAAYNAAWQDHNPYRLILLDLEIPEVSGLDILEKIRTSERQAGIPLGEGVPVIVVTAHRRRFLEAFDKGCDDYILKPIDAAVLISKVSQFLKRP